MSNYIEGPWKLGRKGKHKQFIDYMPLDEGEHYKFMSVIIKMNNAENYDPNAIKAARLVCAAPEMLYALREAVIQLEYVDSKFPTGTTPTIIARINAVINKATGEVS